MNQILDYYNNNAQAFFENTYQIEMESFYTPFLRYLPEQALILDLGCGSGRDTLAFKNKGHQVEAIDYSAELVRKATELTCIKVRHQSFYELNDVATLQYQNSSKEAYIVVIEDAKDQLESLGMKFTSANNFLEEFIKDYKTDNENREVKNNLTFKANGNDCAQLELYWTEDETDFFMLITAIETKTHFYKILNWTITDNVKTLKNDFQAIAKSLRD